MTASINTIQSLRLYSRASESVRGPGYLALERSEAAAVAIALEAWIYDNLT
jgi:hypothetical protein